VIRLDICIVRSPDDELVNEGECERGGVGGLSFSNMEVVIPGGVHNIESHETSVAPSAGISTS
jgi:hypothetical protein